MIVMKPQGSFNINMMTPIAGPQCLSVFLTHLLSVSFCLNWITKSEFGCKVAFTIATFPYLNLLTLSLSKVMKAVMSELGKQFNTYVFIYTD